MPALLIKDFLQTQGLKLPADEIHVAYLTTQAVIKMGNASVERSILWPSEDGWQLADYVDAEHELLLKQIFMALDSVAERTEHLKSAAVYTAFPKDGALSLVRLSRWGMPLENVIPIDEQAGQAFLAVRTAQSGWMNVCQNVAYWQEIGELSDERNHLGLSQISVPVCMPSGAVLGVVHAEFDVEDGAPDEVLVAWIALALALSDSLKNLLGVAESEEAENE